MQTRPLSSDELGEHGDAIFRTLCTKSGLVANKSERDRTGWDYRVEFPNSRLDASIYADKRAVPLPFNVQVKTMWRDKRNFSAPLLSMERLAKSLDPSFVIAIRMHEDTENSEVFLIHLVGPNLEKVLKRLTRESSKNSAITNQKTITFTRDSTWRLLKPSERLEDVVNETCRAYARSGSYSLVKEKELREAGYGPYPVTFHVKVQSKSQEELIDGLLGLRPLELIEFEGREERFGFERPYALGFSGPGTLHIEPLNGPACQIFFRHHRYGTPVVRKGTAIASPFGPTTANFRMIVKSDPIQLDMNSSGTFTLKVADLSGRRHPISTWIEIFAILEMMGSSEFCIELYTEDAKKLYGGAVNGALLSDGVTAGYQRVLALLKEAEELLGRIGQREMVFSINEILSSGPALRMCLDLVNVTGTHFGARLDGLSRPVHDLLGNTNLGILVDTLQIGPLGVTFAAVAEITMAEDARGPLLEGAIARQGFVEPSSSMPIETFADTIGREVGASYRIIGDGSGSLLGARGNS